MYLHIKDIWQKSTHLKYSLQRIINALFIPTFNVMVLLRIIELRQTNQIKNITKLVY